MSDRLVGLVEGEAGYLLARVLPPGVTLLRVAGAPAEIRRLEVVRLPGPPSPTVRSLTRAIASALSLVLLVAKPVGGPDFDRLNRDTGALGEDHV